MANLSKVNVLIIDDNAHMIHIVRSMLLGFGITRTFESRDAVEAFDIARSDPVDLIIADYQMPILDGLEFTRMIRTGADSRDPYVPIILLTAHTERSRIIAARDVGVTEVCAKPINAHQMWTEIAAIVNHSRQFVRAKDFFGPDRRRRDVDYEGEERRAAVVDKPADAEPQSDEGASAGGAAA